jgi:lactoylglutathione lyase
MQSLTPILSARDVDAALAFYRDVLGFTVDYRLKDGAGTLARAGLSRGGVRLMLCADSGHSDPSTARLGRNARYGGGVELYFHTREVDGLYREFAARGARVQGPPEDRFTGDRTFAVIDPDNHRLEFAAPASAAAA